MDAPSLDSLRQEIDAIDGDLHGLIRRRADLVDRIAAAKPPGGLALRPGREAQVMRQRLATHQGAFPAGRRLPHVARDDVRLHADADAGPQGRDLPAGRPAGLLGSRARPFRLPDPVRRQRHAGPGAGARCAPTPRPSASCRRRSRPTPRRGGRCWRAVMPTLPNVVARLPFLVMPNARARGISAFVLARMEPEECGDDRALISIEAASRPQPQPHRRRPGQGRACPPSLRRWTRLRTACITISSSCRA